MTSSLSFPDNLKTVEHEGDGWMNSNLRVRFNPQSLGRGTWRINSRTTWQHLDYSIIMMGQNPEKSPSHSKIIAVIQTPVKYHQLTLVGKISEIIILIIIIICRLCGERDETINHIISECSKLAQREYKARHEWVGKAIHWEICKKFKFDHTNKWYMHNPAAVLENDSHKLLWDFNIQTDHLIPARRPDLKIINKKRQLAK